jgi:peptide methionine sulfoxide reductase MsrA
MALFLPLVAGLLMFAGAHASDVADRSMHQGFLSQYMGSDVSKTSLDDYNKFVTPRFNYIKHGGAHKTGGAKIVDKEEERAMQKVLANDNSLPIGLSAIGVSLLTLAAMLGVRMRRGQQQATAFASRNGHESDMSIALAPAVARNSLELKTQESIVRDQVGWSQQSSENLRPPTFCYATPSSAADFTDVQSPPGILAPTGSFDPAGLSEGVSLSELKLTHGRVAMLASHRQFKTNLDRRSLLAATAGAVLAPLAQAQPALAVNDELVDVYFGCGCFWHVQHEFAEAEKKILGRTDKQLTSRAGYAGGNTKGKQPCYHNLQGKNDYGKFGHAEVVGMQIPASNYGDFAREYFNLLGPDGSRPDQFGDRGPEYRNLIGVPGGKESPFVKDLMEATLKEGDKVDFAKGKGNDADLKALVWIMDTNEHPFWRGENYHQFHDGFARGENYPDSYNSLGNVLDLEDTTCPSF